MLLYGLERQNPQSRLTVDADETKRIIDLDIPLPHQHLCVTIASGAFVNDTVIPTVLTGATMVVCVISASMNSTLQHKSFGRYVTCAVQVGAHWE